MAALVLKGFCPECGTAERKKPMGEGEVVIKLHTPWLVTCGKASGSRWTESSRRGIANDKPGR